MGLSKYPVLVPTTETYRAMVKCQAACPVNTDARGYVTAIGNQDLRSSYAIARDPNPLASMCGQICGAPCEVACRRGDLDSPVAIRPLKRVVTQKYGPESRIHLPAGRQPAMQSLSIADFSTVKWSQQSLNQLARTAGRKPGRVALIGAGPSSLSAAHDLALLGYDVSIYEAGEKAGGMIRYGVPAYRIDWEMMDLEIQQILDLGVEIHYNTPIGENVSLLDLHNSHDAVFLGIGLMQGRNLNIPGHDLDGVVKAVDLLLNFNMGYRLDLGKRVVVIGGGDVAMDAARTALRAGNVSEAKQLIIDQSTARREEEAEAIHDAFDVARTALRMGATEVTVFALENWHELPASQLEIEEALEEGIQIIPQSGPNQILGQDGKVTGIETIKVESVFDEEGKFNPKFVENSETQFACDSVVMAIGQMADLSLLDGFSTIEINPRGYVKVDPETSMTSIPGLFAGGDVAQGPRLLIHAVRDGHIAALGIDRYIQRRQHKTQVTTEWTEMPGHKMPAEWLAYQRKKVPSMPVDRRTGISQVEIGYSDEEAQSQGLRCLECSINTVFDGSLCILCNGCVDVCPWDCLKITALEELSGDALLNDTIAALVDHDGVALNSATTGMATIIKDDSTCTRCALCVDRCPTNAITMESFRFQESLGYEESKK